MPAQDQVAQQVLDRTAQPQVDTGPTPTTVTQADLAVADMEDKLDSVAVVDTGMAMAGAVMVHAVFPVIGAAVLEHDIQVENKLDQVRLEQAQVQAQLVTADQVKQPTVVWWWYMLMRKEIKWQ
jgi:hypothetical protein